MVDELKDSYFALQQMLTMSQIALNLIDAYGKSGELIAKEAFMRSMDGLNKMVLNYNQSLDTPEAPKEISEKSENIPENPLDF